MPIKDIDGIESNDHENDVSEPSKRLCGDVKKPQASPFDRFQAPHKDIWGGNSTCTSGTDHPKTLNYCS